MSSLYNLEPQPTGKVLLQTTAGDILLELFAKQTPLTSRNFLQLCLDGYYDGSLFHRLVPGFIVQGGDPSGTGSGGDAIYEGGRFADEFHSRLKFNRRGLLGMANSGKKDDNGSQFFLTLDKTEELQGRNTMFGRVVGDTIYNLMKMGEGDLIEGSDRPLYPIKITGTEILVNPFDDMVRQDIVVKATAEERKPAKKKPKTKGGKVLLSFGGDDGEELPDLPLAKKSKFNPTLVDGGPPATKGTEKPKKANSKAAEQRLEGPSGRRSRRRSSSPLQSTEDPTTRHTPSRRQSLSRSPTSPCPSEPKDEPRSALDRTNAQIAELKASMRRIIPTAHTEVVMKSALEQVIPEASIRGRKRKLQGTEASIAREKEAIQMIKEFQSKLEKAAPELQPPPSQGPDEKMVHESAETNGPSIGEDDEEAQLCDLHFIANCKSCRSWDGPALEGAQAEADDDHGWMSHALSFEKDRLGKDLTWKRKAEEELVVIDPREKEKEIKDQLKGKRTNKPGVFTKAWDRDRGRDSHSTRAVKVDKK